MFGKVMVFWIILCTAVPSYSVVTKRFGECATCDVRNVARDAEIDKGNQNTANGGGTSIQYRYGKNLIFYFDLSSIPAGTRVRSARFVMFNDIDYGEDSIERNKPVYMLKDPNSTGMWTEATVTYAAKHAGVGWSSGANATVSAVYDSASKIGEMAIYPTDNGYFTFDYWDADVTAGAQAWVDNPAKNLGMLIEDQPTFNKWIIAKENADSTRRPYLEVTYEAPQTEAIPAPTGISAKYYKGQTFITWTEATTGKNETSYRIYRSASAITPANLDNAQLLDQVYQGSSYLTDGVKTAQPDLSPAGVTLQAGSGLYVYPVENSQTSYYAVTTVVEGNENRDTIAAASSGVSEAPGMPDAFAFGTYYTYTGYVMWLGKFNYANPADTFGFFNKRSMPFRFSLAIPPSYSPSKKFGISLWLHPYSHGYYDSQEGTRTTLSDSGCFAIGIHDMWPLVMKDATGTVVGMGNYLHNYFGDSFYTGWNSNLYPSHVYNGCMQSFGVQKPLFRGRSVNYCEKSIVFVVDWFAKYSQWASDVDTTRMITSQGGSMGAIGSFQLATHYPEKFVAIAGMVGAPNPKGTSVVWDLKCLFGPASENIPMPDGSSIDDYLNSVTYINNHREKDYPYVWMANGKCDSTVFWMQGQAADYYRALQNAGGGLVAYWGQFGHTSGDPLMGTMFPEAFCGNNCYLDGLIMYNWIDSVNRPGYNLLNFRRNQSFVAFKNFSLDSNPGSGHPDSGDARGSINRLPWYDRFTIKDSTKHYEVELFLLDYTADTVARATVMPGRLQRLKHAPGTEYAWKNFRKSDGSLLDSGTVVADLNGKIAIPNVTLLKSRSRLTIDSIGQASSLVENTLGGKKYGTALRRNFLAGNSLEAAVAAIRRAHPEKEVAVYDIYGQKLNTMHGAAKKNGMYFIVMNKTTVYRVMFLK